MEKNEFINRYMEKAIALLGVRPSFALDMAEGAWDGWDGVFTPEEEAEEEAYYWAADADPSLI